MLEGGCHCKQVRYQVEGPAVHVALCHCTDCRRHAGAPAVSWAAVKADQLDVAGEIATYASSDHGRRQFCPKCGTGLFYINDAALPGLIDIQSSTLDDPEAMPPGVQIQTADRLEWVTRIGELPAFERYPG